jgi:hypothetical protein
MALQAPPAETARRWRRRPDQVLRWMSGRRALLAAVLSAALGLLAALGELTSLGSLTGRHGAAGWWIFLAFALPQGWAMSVMTYTLLRPALIEGSGRDAIIGRWLRWSTLFALLVQQVPALYYTHWLDSLQLSGWLVLLIGLELVGRAPARLHQALQRLLTRQAISPAQGVEDLQRGLERTGHSWSVVSGWCVAGALLITSPSTLIAASWRSWTLGPAASDLALLIVAGAVAGSWLGRMAGYGRLLNSALRKQEVHLRVILSHPDGAGGLKPIGDFHLYQSLTASLPAIFLAVWVLLISLGGANRLWGGYRPYLDQYLWLLPLAMLFEILVFAVPMNAVHTIMRKHKEDVFLPEADRLSPAIVAAQAGLALLASQADGEPEAARQRLALLTEHHQELENAPTWPVDSSIRRRFTWRNLGLLIPFAGYILGHQSFWQQISDVFKG